MCFKETNLKELASTKTIFRNSFRILSSCRRRTADVIVIPPRPDSAADCQTLLRTKIADLHETKGLKLTGISNT